MKRSLMDSKTIAVSSFISSLPSVHPQYLPSSSLGQRLPLSLHLRRHRSGIELRLLRRAKQTVLSSVHAVVIPEIWSLTAKSVVFAVTSLRGGPRPPPWKSNALWSPFYRIVGADKWKWTYVHAFIMATVIVHSKRSWNAFRPIPVVFCVGLG